jgi:stage II sporulation protein P
LGGEGPKVLIFHTHASEAYADSRPDQDGVVAVGAALARVLARDYGVTVVHDRGRYDGGSPPRPNSYEVMEPAARKLLEKYPTLEVLVDLHRDALPQGMRLVTDIDGQPAAKLMFFNGVTRLNLEGQPVPPGLHNPYLQDNLAFSFQAQLVANALYPGLMRRIYIRPYRYSLHLRPKSLLVEVGSDANTYQEALNAVGPLAEILVTVLGGAR